MWRSQTPTRTSGTRNPEADASNYFFRASGWMPPVAFDNVTLVQNSSCDPASGVAPEVCDRGGMFATYRVGLDGPASRYDPPTSYWAQEHPGGGGPAQYSIPSGMVVNKAKCEAIGC